MCNRCALAVNNTCNPRIESVHLPCIAHLHLCNKGKLEHWQTGITQLYCADKVYPSQAFTREFSMLVNKTKAASLAGVSRRTFYNHISKKGISTVTDEEGVEKVDVSELKRIYGHELILRNLKKMEEAQAEVGNDQQVAQSFPPQSVQVEQLLLQEKLKSAQTLIEQLTSERDQLREDKKQTHEQLEKALEIGGPIRKLLTDQRDQNEGRAVAERKAIEESMRRESAEKKLRKMAHRIKMLRSENEQLKRRGIFQWLVG